MTVFEWAALAGAFAWLPTLTKTLKNLFTKPEVRIIVERTAEVGFSPFGPILNPRVAFAVRNRDIVVTSIRIALRHETGEERYFSWQGVVQRLGQMSVPETMTIPLERELSVLAIKLTPTEIEERFIRFQEDDYRSRKEAVEAKAAKRLNYLKGSGSFDLAEHLRSEEVQDVIAFQKRWFNWKPGRYTIRFEMDSPEAFVLRDNKYEFTMTALFVEALESNKELFQVAYEDQLNLGVKDYQYHDLKWNWVYPTLNKIS